jgi:parallel beta-helix repeat protein
VVLAAWGTSALLALQPGDLPRVDVVSINARVLGAALAAALGTALLFGFVPLIGAGRRPWEALRQGGRGATDARRRNRFRQALIAGEVALALVLLSGAGLLIRSFTILADQDPGYATAGVLTTRLTLPSERYADDASRRDFYASLVSRLVAVPGVAGAGAVSNLPLESSLGDINIRIEGRLIAKGTKEAPILFTSAQEKPAMKDWTFVQISVSRDSLVEHCIFEYAFSGLQVHYSTATIRENLFRYNFEGVRFSTTDIRIEHNDFLENYYGIRCEANGSRTTVTKNNFRKNDYAFFPVRKTGSSVRFFANNIESSKVYQTNLGQTQNEDLDLSKNWWGTTDPGEIAAAIFDKRKDAILGKVIFEPFLLAPVEDAGRH